MEQRAYNEGPALAHVWYGEPSSFQKKGACTEMRPCRLRSVDPVAYKEKLIDGFFNSHR